jgi:hypothetical protein
MMTLLLNKFDKVIRCRSLELEKYTYSLYLDEISLVPCDLVVSGTIEIFYLGFNFTNS